MSELAYIYLLQDGHDKGTNVYKIGRTVQKGGDGRRLKRLQGYTKGTVQYNTSVCVACNGNQEGIYNERLDCGDNVRDDTHFSCIKDVLYCDNVSKEYTKNVVYECPRCGYSTDVKCNFIKHIVKRQTLCPCTKADVSLDALIANRQNLQM